MRFTTPALFLALFTTSCIPGLQIDPPAEGEGEGDEGEGEDGEEGEGDEGEGDEGEGEGDEGEGDEGEGEEGEGEEGEGDVVDCGNRDQGPGDSCATGLGACLRRGVITCADEDTPICTAVPGEPLARDDRTADGVDDDCDGAVDEDSCLSDPERGSACSAGVGACERRGENVCVDNHLECNAEEGAPLDDEDASEDGVDDDCDGVVDEDVVGCEDQEQFGDACRVGVGACERAGHFICDASGDHVVCDAVAAAPGATVDDDGDGVDDDCDGGVDEDAVSGDRAACVPGSECCFANVYDVPRERFFHVDEGPDDDDMTQPECDLSTTQNPTTCRREECTDPFHQLVWQNNPPASGPHMGCTWGSWGATYNESEPLERGYYVHNIEHGGIVFLWGPTATAAAKTELLAAFNGLSINERCENTLAVATYDAALVEPVAVVAIDRILLPDGSGVIPRAAAIEFAEGCRDNGPEQTCYRGPPIMH